MNELGPWLAGLGEGREGVNVTKPTCIGGSATKWPSQHLTKT